MRIAILLATYNSEKYLTEQLDSLLGQTNQDFTIYIRDDGSSDSTLDIVNSYISGNSGKIVLMQDSVKGRKAKGSFMWLLENVQADYYMFCDHDDYWLPLKVELTLDKMKLCEIINPSKAVLIHTDLTVVNEKLEMIHPSFFRRTKLKVEILKQFNYLGVCNCATGCTMMINQRTKIISLPMSDDAPMHDWWIAAIVAKDRGVIEYIGQSTIMYRQHSDNVVGARNITFKYFVSKTTHFFATIEGHKELFPFHKAINYGGIFKFYWFKIVYTIRRNLR